MERLLFAFLVLGDADDAGYLIAAPRAAQFSTPEKSMGCLRALTFWKGLSTAVAGLQRLGARLIQHLIVGRLKAFGWK